MMLVMKEHKLKDEFANFPHKGNTFYGLKEIDKKNSFIKTKKCHLWKKIWKTQ